MKTLLTLFLLLQTVSLFSQTEIYGSDISLGQEVYDFGTVKLSSDTLVANFYFKNSGNSNLLIEDVKPGCGCTVANYTKEPILPGNGGVIILKYVATTEGPINKSATIISNSISNPYKVIRIKGEVIK